MDYISVFLAVFALYLRTAAPTITTGDTPELFLATFNLDVTHPPGYALLALLGRLAYALPAGSLMFRASLLSAAAGAGTCALAYSCVRALGTGRSPAALTALLLAVQPLLWWQSTMLEKYSLQMLLFSLALRVMLADRPNPVKCAFAGALALAHHSLAVFLVPLLAIRFFPPLAAQKRVGRAVAVALALGILPLSVRVVFPAVRADAMHRAEAVPQPAGSVMRINWGEPYNFGALADYLRLKYYSVRFTNVNLSRATWAEHLSFLPRHLTWPGLLAGLAGLAILVRRSRAVGLGLAGILVLSFLFNLRFTLPPALADVYHQDEFIVLAVCAGVSLEALRRAASRRRLAWPVAAPALAAGILAWGAPRFAVFDGGRHFFAYDYLSTALALAPRGSVFVAGFDADRFAAGYFQQALGRRKDLTPLPVPHKVMPGHFVVRRHYVPWVRALLPGAVIHFGEEDDGFTILRRLVEDNRKGLCFSMSGLSEPAVPHDLFRRLGPVYLAVDGSCADAGMDLLRAWRSVPTRTWFDPSRAIPAHRTVMDSITHGMVLSAGELAGRSPRAAELLLGSALRLAPRAAYVWGQYALFLRSRGDTGGAAAALQRAIELDPGAPENLSAFLDLNLRHGGRAQVESFLAGMADRSPVARMPAAAAVRRALAGGDLDSAVRLSRRALSELALAQAERTPGNPEFVMRKLFLYRFSAEGAPDWVEAQERCGLMLAATADYAGAERYLGRASALNPRNVQVGIRLATVQLAAARYDASAATLARLARTSPEEPAVWFYLGQAETARGRPEAGRRAFERFLVLAPNAPSAGMVRNILSRLGTAR